jgi:hypothetical protein
MTPNDVARKHKLLVVGQDNLALNDDLVHEVMIIGDEGAVQPGVQIKDLDGEGELLIEYGFIDTFIQNLITAKKHLDIVIRDLIREKLAMKVVKAPAPYKQSERSLFMAGSIEMGVAEDWQTKLGKELEDIEGLALNPRRDDWDSSWEQSIDDPQFREQVEWEMDAMDAADVIAMYFDKDTKSPITLLELGLHANDGKLIIFCPKGFWRRGNVEVVASRFDIPMAETWEEFVTLIRTALNGKP